MRVSQRTQKPPLSIFPSLIWFVFFLIIPLGIVVLYSALQKGDYGKIEFALTAENYRRLLEPLYLKIVFRSFLLASGTTAMCLILSFPLAYFMAKSGKKFKTTLLAMVVIPFWTNFVIRIYALKLVLGENGAVNRFLLHLGLISSPLQFTDNLIGIGVGMIYNYLPFMILPLFVALEKFDFTLMDAAYDLGANKFKTIFKVLVPLSLPGIVTGSLFVFIPSFGEFVIPDLLGGAHTMFVGSLITETFLKSRDWPLGSALSSILVLFAMIAFMVALSRAAKKQEAHA